MVKWGHREVKQPQESRAASICGWPVILRGAATVDQPEDIMDKQDRKPQETGNDSARGADTRRKPPQREGAGQKCTPRCWRSRECIWPLQRAPGQDEGSWRGTGRKSPQSGCDMSRTWTRVSGMSVSRKDRETGLWSKRKQREAECVTTEGQVC